MTVQWLYCFVLAAGSWILIFQCVNSTEESVTVGPKCKRLFTFGYGYRQLFHVSPNTMHQGNSDKFFMKFMVKAHSDGHILLSPSPSPEESDPVYEIVLGGGRNSFCDIRRKRAAASKFSVRTKDILSGTKMKGFWIKINGEGIIQVGQEGEDLPFMDWQDPDPLHIEYFSFCSWAGVDGEWLYDCVTINEENESNEVEPTLTATGKLRKALLTNYDVYSRPIFNSSEIIQINLEIQANHVQLDAQKSVMTVGCLFKMVWYDEKMVWDPTIFNNLSMLNLVHNEIWQPELIHLNAAGKGVSPLGRAGMRVTADGKVTWRPRSNLQSRCHLNLRKWPWDTQRCTIQLGFWNQADALQLILLENGTRLEMQKTSSEWIVLKLDAESVFLKTPQLLDSMAFSSDGSDDAEMSNLMALTFTFVLKRVNNGYVYVLVIPLIVMMVMSLTCFWMDPLGKEKLVTNCLLLILLCGFLINLEMNLPAPADHTPYLFRAYSWVLIVVATATVITVFITNLVNMSHHWLLPRPIFSALTTKFIASLFCLPTLASKTKDYGELSETGETSDYSTPMSSPLECRNPDNVLWGNTDVDSVANCSWALLALFCDRIAFVAALLAYTAILVMQ